MSHDYKKALSEFHGGHHDDEFLLSKDSVSAIRHALKLADKVTGEPSPETINEMSYAYYNAGLGCRKPFDAQDGAFQNEIREGMEDAFKAMIAQAIKEID